MNLILPWAPKDAEAVIRKAIKSVLNARKLWKQAAMIAYYWFFETVARPHG